MIITVDKDYKVLGIGEIEGIDNEFKIVDSVPNDLDIRDYRYSMGKFIDLGEAQTSQEEINLDFDYRLCCLELGI